MKELLMNVKKMLVVCLVALGAYLSFSSGTASASFSYTLGVGNSDISGYTGPYGKVDVTLVDSTHATITLTALNNGGNYYLFGDGGTLGVNVHATSFTFTI